MLLEIWNSFLFQPLYNVLILIYNNWTDQNFGWAIIYLTLMLRVVLLPLLVVSILNQRKNKKLEAEVTEVAKQFQHDPVQQKAEVRRLLKEKKVSPWAKAVSLGIQALVVVVLYEVFLFGLEGNRIFEYLYPWVEYPGNINTLFLGYSVKENHNVLFAGIVGIWLFVEGFLDMHSHKDLKKKDLAYLFLFPAAVFIILWILPMMKALFFLTSMIFGAVVGGLLKLIIRPKQSTDSDS